MGCCYRMFHASTGQVVVWRILFVQDKNARKICAKRGFGNPKYSAITRNSTGLIFCL